MRGIGRKVGIARIVAKFVLVLGLGVFLPAHAKAQDFILGDSTIATDQLLGLCEHACFAATTSFTTVPYYTLNTARNLTLVYNEDRAHPRPIITADVRPNGGIADEWVLSATLNGNTVTFTNGDTQIYFQGYDIAPLRLLGQFDASGWSNGVYTLVVTVTGMFTFPTTTNITHTYTTKIVIDNEQGSTVAKGWTIAGVQRLYVSGWNYWITNGDGSISLWSSLGTTAKDFSVLASAGGGDYVRTFVDGSKAYFHSTGLMYKTLDRLGNETDYDYYSGTTQLKTIKDPQYVANGSGRYITLGYGTYGVTTIRDSLNGSNYRTTTVSYNGSGQLAKIKDPDNDSTLITYDGSARLDSVTDRRGGVTTYSYNEDSWKLDAIQYPAVTIGGVSSRPYEAYTAWQAINLPTGSTDQWSPVAAPKQAEIVASITTPMGSTTYTVNRYGQPMTITGPSSQVTTITRVGMLPVKISYPTGGADTLAYAYPLTHPFPIMIQRAGTGEVDYSYDYTYHQLSGISGPGVTEAEGRFLGSGGRVDSVRYGTTTTRMVRLGYDGRNRVTSITDPHAHVTTLHYDATTGNADSTATVGGVYAKRRFDAIGRDSLAFTSGTSYWIQTQYDVMNRFTRTWRVGSTIDDTTAVTYDALYPVRFRGPGNHLYKFEVNPLGWVTKRYATDDTTTYMAYSYDLDGFVTGVTNRRGQTVSYNYDSYGRLLSRSASGMTSDTYTYSTNGRILTSLRSNVSRDSAFLNVAMQPDSIIRRVAGQRFALKYTYNVNGLLTAFDITPDFSINFTSRAVAIDTDIGVLDTLGITNAVNGGNSVFSYNSDHMLTSVASPSSITQSFSYTARHIPYALSVSSNNEFTRAYTVDSLNRKAVEIAQYSGGGLYTLRNFTYSNFGQLLNVHRTTASGCTITTDSVAGTLASGCLVSDTTTLDNSTYDAAGNRSVSGASYSGAGNHLVKWSTYDTLTYDNDGNLKTRKHGSVVDTLFWSPISQLDSLHSGGRRVTYEYNGDGQLVRRSTNGTVDRYFLWDEGDRLLAELHGPAGSVGRIAEYIYTPDGGAPLAVATDSASSSLVRYFQHDGTGSVIGVTNRGWDQLHTVYGAWGTVENQLTYGMADTNRIRWKGLMYEGDSTRLYYAKNRWYDPQVGRFISEDPVGAAGGFNLYVFAENDPINGVDPLGTCPYQLPDGTKDDAPEGAYGLVGGKPVVKCGSNGEWEEYNGDGIPQLDPVAVTGDNPSGCTACLAGSGPVTLPSLPVTLPISAVSASPPPPPPPTYTKTNCAFAILSTALSAGADLSWAFGVGEAVVLARAGTRLATLGTAALSSFVAERLIMVPEHQAARMNGMRYVSAIGAHHLTEFSKGVALSVGAGETPANPLLDYIKDITPGLGTYRAYTHFKEACAAEE